MNVKAAKKLVCPMSLNGETPKKCIAGQCMAWNWDVTWENNSSGHAQGDISDTNGSCGWEPGVEK